ncbi:uncharacterized protein [Montipora foliosa]|uniref:uncharacterized protein n=1 Tax=Montipora foliosa TaxID=591990 RepID=UPI0035F18D8F
MNLNKDEREALHGLTKDENVVIVPADKGRCLVVLNREDYDQKCKSLLDDKKTYKLLGCNPTNGFRKKVCTFTNKIYTEGTIKVDFKRKLDPPSETSVPAFYGLPKIHKPEPIPLRPIVSSIGSVTYNLAKHSAYIPRPLVGCSSHHLKKTQAFVEKIREIKLTTEETITSYDVSALFTSIPADEAITAIRQRLEKDETLAERTCPRIEEVVELVDICLTTTYFSFKGKFYKQIHGCAMGSPISPIVANLCMEVFEERALGCYNGVRPRLWLRYVDDTFVILEKNETSRFLHLLNSQDFNIKFTQEQCTNNLLPFLDCLVKINSDGSIPPVQFP